MTLLVVSAMFGGGVFNIPQNMAQQAALGAILIAWLISGLGVFFVARSFQVLADIHPELTSGIYMYARAGFGRLAGFLIAWGYWLSVAFGNVSYAVLLMDALNYFFPPYFEDGNTWQATLGSSLILWGLCFLVMRGVKGASLLNSIGTMAKFLPALVFLAVVVFFSLGKGLFTVDVWGNTPDPQHPDASLGSLLDQIKSTMLVTLWMYIGIECAVVMSDQSDAKTVSRATILGYFIVTVIFVLISVAPFGVMSQTQLAALAPPSTAGIMMALVGYWGEVFINIGIIIALLSSWLVWTLLVAQLPWVCAKDGTFPKFFAKTNAASIASNSLIVSTLIMQAALILVFFADNAWNLMLSITGVVILPAYIGSAVFLWKIIWKGNYPITAKLSKNTALVTSVLATCFGLWLIYAAGIQFLLVGAVIYAAGLPVFYGARLTAADSDTAFSKTEALAATSLLSLAGVAVWLLIDGRLPQVFSG